MRNRTPSLVALLAALVFGAACSAPDAIVGINAALASETTVEEMYRLVGQGNYSSDGSQPDLVVNAIRTFSGEIKGNVIIPRDGIGKAGSVVGIVPPSASFDYWCVAVALDAQPGATQLIYVRDIPDGADQITFGGGTGATCESSPLPPFDEWMPLVTGNFTGTVKTK